MPLPTLPSPTLSDLYTPKLVTVLREGYGPGDLRRDVVSGLTVAIVALPLSMAIAIASGASPQQGLVTAIVGGFIVSLLGGSRHQIGGPAGAFIPLVASTLAIHGMDGLVLATFMAGVMLVAVGALRIGTYIRYIPYPVTVGFTAGIAVIIAASQIRDLLGLVLTHQEPPDVLHKLPVLLEAIGTLNPMALLLGGGAVGIILVLRRLAPRVPAMLVAIVAASMTAYVLTLPVETIGSRFGTLASTIEYKGLPDVSLARLRDLMVPAIAIALLGGIESLLSAVVADGMSGHRHRSNCELVAQGLANMACALCGGLCVTGTIARTATNVRSGARGPVSGMMHSLFLAGFLAIGSGLISHIPLTALAGLLLVVAWNMIERRDIAMLTRASPGDAMVVWASLVLTVVVDLTAGIMVGIVLGSILVMHRMAEALDVQLSTTIIEKDTADVLHRPTPKADDGTLTFRLSGAFFFGAAATVSSVLDRIGSPPKRFVLDLSAVVLLDTTGAHMLAGVIDRLASQGVAIEIAGARAAVREVLDAFGVKSPRVTFRDDRSGSQA